MRIRFQIIISLVLVLFISSKANAQSQICRSYGGMNDDQAYALVEASDGGYVMAGQTKSFGAGGLDVYVIKIDLLGNIVWTKTIGGSGDEYAYSMAKASDGGYIIGGTTNSFGAGAEDFYFIKLDKDGNIEWTKTAGGTGNDRAYEVVETKDQGFAMAGLTTSFGAAPNDVYVVKLDASGNLLWDKRYGNNSTADIGYSLTATTDGGLAVCGTAYYFTGSVPTSSVEYYIMKLSGDGTLQWTRLIRNPDNPIIQPDYARSIIQTADGGYMISGEASKSKSSGGYVYKIFLVKLDSGGNVSWTKFYGANAIAGESAFNSDYGECVIQTSDGGYVVAGYTFSFNYDFGIAKDVGLELYIIKVDANGTLLWTRVIGGEENQIGKAIIPTSDGGFAVAGYQQPRTAGQGSDEFYFMKMDAALNNCCNTRSGGAELGTAATSITYGSSFNGGATLNSGGTASSGGTLTDHCKTTLEVKVDSVHVRCKGACDGSATATALGGTSPFTFNWSNGQSGTSVSGLCAGNYSVIVIDNTGTRDTAYFSISEPPLPLTLSISDTAASCNGVCDGSSKVTAIGGSPGYNFQWNTNPVQNTSIAKNLCAGEYECIVTDQNGCRDTLKASITEPEPIQAQASSTAASCGQNNGSATATVISGGTAPFSYSWNTNPLQNTATASNIAAGTYNCTITDAKACTETLSVTVGSSSEITVSGTSSPVSCPGGTDGGISVSVQSGTEPYSYSWDTNPAQNAASITGLKAGIYSCTITDGNNCILIYKDTITEPEPFLAEITNTPSCGENSGSASVSLSGGNPPYTFVWTPGNVTGTQLSGVTSGDYTVTYTDSKNCTGTELVQIQTFAIPLIDAGTDQEIAIGESVVLNATGTPGAYSWEPSESLSCDDCVSTTASPTETTVYTVSVTTPDGCSNSDTVLVKVNIICGEVFVPNAFSPNGDGENDKLCVYGNCFKTLRFMIFDRWGEKVFDTDDTKPCWDGTFRNKTMNSAVFGYYLEGTLYTGEEVKRKGEINLVR